MKPVDPTVPRITEDGLKLIVGGRTYGDAACTPDDLRRMAVPSELHALGAALQAHSKLAGLLPDAAREAIYTAYGHDLELLARYRAAFRTTIEAAVRARAAPDQPAAQAFLQRITAQIAAIDHAPTLDLGSAALQLEPAALLARLREQFAADIAQLEQSVAAWMHMLAEDDTVSVIEWFNPRALRYHFFRMDEERHELARDVIRTGDYIRGRTITTTATDLVNVVSERRVHTVVNAQSYRPEEYRRRVPARIARLIDAIPEEVRPFVAIIDGTVTNEDVHRQIAESRIVTETHSVFIPDPALALFNTWAVTGWGGSAEEPATSLYRGHVLARADRILAAEAVGTAIATGLGALAEGRRGAFVIAAVCLILTAFQQLGMRIPERRE
ncbi:MAG: hypothetical protein JO047_12725 [Alphaproteobacteria bacterium]|nr:hypothetical protein [Alphaproteobacteria bacterium]